jgi:hypothetical protein
MVFGNYVIARAGPLVHALPAPDARCQQFARPQWSGNRRPLSSVRRRLGIPPAVQGGSMRFARTASRFVVIGAALMFVTAGPAAAQDAPPTVPSAPATAPAAGHPQTRDGFWFNAGLGYGSLGCESCVGRADGLSGGLSLGATMTPHVLLGLGTTGWTKRVAGGRLSAGTVDLRTRYYPVTRSGFFLTGGIGLGSVSFAGDSEHGVGVVLGVGWDIRVGTNTSLTVFYNGFAMSNANLDANVGQIGIGVTIH